jgi:hypothetical protein
MNNRYTQTGSIANMDWGNWRTKKKCIDMNTNEQNFLKWYKFPLEQLYKNSDAGFAIMILSLPLLERYLREKSRTFELPLSAAFFQECIKVFPPLGTEQRANKFWRACRHGLLHQVTFKQGKTDESLPKIALTGNTIEMQYIEKEEIFCLNPVWFSKKIIGLIEADFSTFEGTSSLNHKLPQVSSLTVSVSPSEKSLENVDTIWLCSGIQPLHKKTHS